MDVPNGVFEGPRFCWEEVGKAASFLGSPPSGLKKTKKMKMIFLILFRIISKISVIFDWKVSHTNKVQKLLLF